MPFQICRICYTRGHDLLQLCVYEKKLSSCIPEIDIYIINDPGICRKCADMLDTAFELRNLCLENEKRYNSMFKERDKVICKEEPSESGAFEVDENNDGENLLDVLETASELSILCSMCNEEFSSSHDRKLHDFKMHRALEHRKLKSLLSPIQNSNQDLLTMQNIIDYTVLSTIEEGDSSISNANINDSAGTVICSECCMTFADNNELESHKTIHLRKSCSTCKKTFDGEKEFRDHVNLQEVKCCGNSFPTVSSLQLHTYQYHNKTCGICSAKFTQFGILFNHLSNHTKCGEEFETNEDLNDLNCNITHSPWEPDGESAEIQRMAVKSTASIGSKYLKYKCKKCNMGHKNRSLLTKHLYKCRTFGRTYVPREESLECCLCERQFELHIHLKMHILQNHCEKMPTVPIVDCRKDTFYREQEGLRINFAVPPDDTGRTNENNILRKKFIKRSKSVCFICRVMFKKVIHLYCHGKNEHKFCCDQHIASMSSFFRHNLTHYNRAERDGVHEDILCVSCKTNYRNYVSLLAHNCKRTKKGKENWESMDEGLANSRCTIEVHERYSSDESDTRARAGGESNSNMCCEICKKEFDSMSRLMDHIKTHI